MYFDGWEWKQEKKRELSDATEWRNLVTDKAQQAKATKRKQKREDLGYLSLSLFCVCTLNSIKKVKKKKRGFFFLFLFATVFISISITTIIILNCSYTLQKKKPQFHILSSFILPSLFERASKLEWEY